MLLHCSSPSGIVHVDWCTCMYMYIYIYNIYLSYASWLYVVSITLYMYLIRVHVRQPYMYLVLWLTMSKFCVFYHHIHFLPSWPPKFLPPYSILYFFQFIVHVFLITSMCKCPMLILIINPYNNVHVVMFCLDLPCIHVHVCVWDPTVSPSLFTLHMCCISFQVYHFHKDWLHILERENSPRTRIDA